MTRFEEFFDGNMFVINLARRPDRRKHFEAEMAAIGVTCVERFEAIDAGVDWGNNGCSSSHRAVMDLIISRGLRRSFIFEDDATVRPQFRSSFQDEFRVIAREIPEDFQMVYLGGHYGSNARAWHSKHLVLIGQMKTTSSYGVTLESAHILRDLIPENTTNAIDNLYAGFNETGRCYISEPRLFVQYGNYSDLQKAVMHNEGCMEDGSHVAALGKYHAP